MKASLIGSSLEGTGQDLVGCFRIFLFSWLVQLRSSSNHSSDDRALSYHDRKKQLGLCNPSWRNIKKQIGGTQLGHVSWLVSDRNSMVIRMTGFYSECRADGPEEQRPQEIGLKRTRWAAEASHQSAELSPLLTSMQLDPV